MTGPLTFRSACVANFPAMKPICANACGSIFVYFLRIASISRVSGPCEASSRPNSELMNSFPSQLPNCPAMNVFAIGVEEPHFTLSMRPCASAAFMSAGAVSGVKSRMIPPPGPAAW